MDWPVLRPLSDEDRRRVLAAARRRRFGRREALFHEGDPGDTLHLIARGRVAVRVTTPLGEVATLVVQGPGAVVGELALLDAASRRTATVVALEPTETLALHRDQFMALRRSHPSIDRFLLEVLAAHVVRLSEHLVEALYVPVDKRVMRRLLALVDVYGRESGPAEIPMTQEDLASLAGTSRATVNRVLGDLTVRGAVAVSRGRIRVLDAALVARRAG